MGNHQSNKQWTERLTYVFEALNTVLLNRTSFALAWLLLTLKGELLATVDNFRLRPLRAPRILIGVSSMSLGQGAPRYQTAVKHSTERLAKSTSMSTEITVELSASDP